MPHKNGAPAIYKLGDANVSRWVHSCWQKYGCSDPAGHCRWDFDMLITLCAKGAHAGVPKTFFAESEYFAHIGSEWQMGVGRWSLENLSVPPSLALLHSATTIKEDVQELRTLNRTYVAQMSL